MKKFHVRSGNKVLALMLTAAMVLGIAGCGSTETPAGGTDAAAAEESSEAGAAGGAAGADTERPEITKKGLLHIIGAAALFG